MRAWRAPSTIRLHSTNRPGNFLPVQSLRRDDPAGLDEGRRFRDDREALLYDLFLLSGAALRNADHHTVSDGQDPGRDDPVRYPRHPAGDGRPVAVPSRPPGNCAGLPAEHLRQPEAVTTGRRRIIIAVLHSSPGRMAAGRHGRAAVLSWAAREVPRCVSSASSRARSWT